MSCCRWTQAFGRPVLPDEYSQKAGSSQLVRSAANSGEPRPISVLKSIAALSAGLANDEDVPHPRAFRDNVDDPRMECGADDEPRPRVSRGAGTRNPVGVHSVLVGIGTAPILMAPKKAKTISGPSSMRSRIRSSGRIPKPRNADPVRLTCSNRLAYDRRLSSHSMAMALPRPSSIWRSMK